MRAPPPLRDVVIARLARSDMDDVARVHRCAFDTRLPWLSGLHAPEEDVAFFRDLVFPSCAMWGARVGGASGAAALAGFIAFRDGWIDHLYVAPEAQGRGVGGALLKVAQCAWPALQLWTFQNNAAARRFYERRGFVLVRETDGAGNEEKEPDALYVWSREPAA
jgi:GNAT superfamily N-acetyltransferase